MLQEKIKALFQYLLVILSTRNPDSIGDESYINYFTNQPITMLKYFLHCYLNLGGI